MIHEDQIYGTSIAVAKLLACELTIPEQAVFASFLQSIAVAIGVHIQTTNLTNANTIQNQEITGDELVVQ